MLLSQGEKKSTEGDKTTEQAWGRSREDALGLLRSPCLSEMVWIVLQTDRQGGKQLDFGAGVRWTLPALWRAPVGCLSKLARRGLFLHLSALLKA